MRALRRQFAPLLLLALTCAAGARARTLEFPFPVLAVTTEAAGYDSYALPVAPWTDEHLPTRMIEGTVLRRAWQLDARDASLLAIVAPLRDQLRAEGFTILLDCKAEDCGGFDFRFATEVMDEPAMHVDLGEFRFLSAVKGDGATKDGAAGIEATGILVSRSAAAVFVQVITVTPRGADSPRKPGAAATGGGSAPPAAAGMPGLSDTPDIPLPQGLGGTGPEPAAGGPAALASRLDRGYAAVLDGLDFESGSDVLADGDPDSARALASWLAADPSRRVLLVGHTDISGTLAANIALSKRRAETVRQVLIRQFGADGSRIEAVGAGPMAPRDTNATQEGRLRNRRVEAVPATP